MLVDELVDKFKVLLVNLGPDSIQFVKKLVIQEFTLNGDRAISSTFSIERITMVLLVNLGPDSIFFG